MVFDLFGEGFAVGEVPCLRIEAALAVVRAAGDKEGVSDARTVRDVVFFDVGVVHDSEMFLMDKMGSGFRVRGSRFRVRGSGFGVQGSGFRVRGSGFRVQGSRFKVQGSGFRVQGSGFRVQGSGFRVQGSGFKVQGWCGAFRHPERRKTSYVKKWLI